MFSLHLAMLIVLHYNVFRLGTATADGKLFEEIQQNVADPQKENRDLRLQLEQMTRERDYWKQKYEMVLKKHNLTDD